MTEHKFLSNQNIWDCYNADIPQQFKNILDTYEIDLTNDYLFEYTRDLNKTDEFIIDCKVYFNKGTSILICSFTLTTNNMLKLILKEGAYSMLILPKSDISKIMISENKKFYAALPCNTDAAIEFKSDNKIDFNLQDCNVEDSEKIIKFIIGMLKN